MKTPRGLSADEAAAWARLAATVKPMRALPARKSVEPLVEPVKAISKPPRGRVPPPRAQPAAPPPPPGPGLDSMWERKLARGTLAPDFTLDLHGHTLSSAHMRLDDGLMQAKALGARVVLLITGKPRPSEAADRGHQRGAIRAKALDWLAAGPHAGDIATVRTAHRRHGGEGALYLVLKRRR